MMMPPAARDGVGPTRVPHLIMSGRVLVQRHLDPWLVGWTAVGLWVLALLLHQTGTGLTGNVVDVAVWVGAVLSAAHFGLSYHLAYRDGCSAVAAAPVVLLVVPIVLATALVGLVALSLASSSAGTVRVPSALITCVYVMTTWHYIKQVYGVGRVGALYAGRRLSASDNQVLRYALYPLWFLGASRVLVQGVNYSLAGFPVGWSLLPHGALTVLQLLALLCAVPIAVVLVRLRRPPAVLVAPYVAAFLWIGLPMNPAMTVLVLAPLHALQYLAVGHRAEVALTDDPVTATWWLNIFVGATCGGLLLTRWLPQLLDGAVSAPGQPALFLSAFFVFLNVHHYLIDASIWRSRGPVIGAMMAHRDSPANRVPLPALTD